MKYIVFFIVAFSLFAFTIDKGKKKKPVKKKKATTAKVVKPKPAVVAEDSTENHYFIIIDKSDYELKVYDDEGWYATYPVVFGSKDLSDKKKKGDKLTPDGSFKIVGKKVHEKWGNFLLLDYPTTESYRRFNERKAKGILPSNADIGGGIAIHATRKEEEWTVDNFYNWTDGCISLKYTEMQDLYNYIPIGTQVTIQQ